VELGFDFMDWSLSEYYWIRMEVLKQMVSAHNFHTDLDAMMDMVQWEPDTYGQVSESMLPWVIYNYLQFFVGPHEDINKKAKFHPDAAAGARRLRSRSSWPGPWRAAQPGRGTSFS